MNTCLPIELHHHIVSTITPSLRWDGETPIEPWRQKCRQQLWELLGMDEIVPCKPNLSIVCEDEIDGNRHIYFTLNTEEGYYTHCDLLLPKEQRERLSLCLCLQGHTRGSHISLGQTRYPDEDKSKFVKDNDFCLRAVKEGFAALAVEQRGFGRCGGAQIGTNCTHPQMSGFLLGRTLIGERVWDVMRVVDAVEESFSHIITMEGSVIMGNSGGGTATYYAACLEDRFYGYMPSCALGTFKGHLTGMFNCTCNYVPRIAKYFDMGDLAIMIAPKKLVMVCAEVDKYYPREGMLETAALIKDIYKKIGAEDNCELVLCNDGHRFYADEAWPVMHRMLGQLQKES